MEPLSDSYPKETDTIGLAMGKITLDRDLKKAILFGFMKGRKIKVVASYTTANFTLEQVLKDLNEALDKFLLDPNLSKNQGSLFLTKNVRLFFHSPSTPKVKRSAMKTLKTESTSGKEKQKVHFDERDEARLLYRDTPIEEKRQPGEKSAWMPQTRPATQQHRRRGPTLSAQSIREQYGPTRVPLEPFTLETLRKMDVDWLYQQALEYLEIKNLEPTDQNIYEAMTKFNVRVETFTEEELLAILHAMPKLSDRRPLDLQKGEIAFKLMMEARKELSNQNLTGTIENMRTAMVQLKQSDFSNRELFDLMDALTELLGVNPSEGKEDWDMALEEVYGSLQALTAVEPTVENLKYVLGLSEKKETVAEVVHDKLLKSFIPLIPRLGSVLDNKEVVKSALSKLLGRAEGAPFTLFKIAKKDNMQEEMYRAVYLVATKEQMLTRIKANHSR